MKNVEKPGKFCEKYGCRIGEISSDDNGDYSFCKICGKRLDLKAMKLEDLDEMPLSELSKIKGTSPEAEAVINFASRHRRMVCGKCGGKLKIVTPKVELGGRAVCECIVCEEREYKIVDEKDDKK